MKGYDGDIETNSGLLYNTHGGSTTMGVKREKRGSRSSCMAEIKAIDEGIKGIQYLQHLMRQLGLTDVDIPTPLLNDNRVSIDWIDSGCRPSKKLRHENLSELGIAEAKQHKEVMIYWCPGKTNPPDIFTKEDNDIQHFQSLRDLMVVSPEDFAHEQVQRWGLTKQSSAGPESESKES